LGKKRPSAKRGNSLKSKARKEKKEAGSYNETARRNTQKYEGERKRNLSYEMGEKGEVFQRKKSTRDDS